MNNMQLGSTSRNINLLSLGVTFAVLLGLFNVTFTTFNIILTVIGFYIFNILGNWMTLHRYYSHNSFEFKNNILKWFFTLLAVLSGRGSPLGWVYLHRKHHAYSDTEKDPHSPKFLGYKIFGFDHYKKQEKESMQIFMVKDLMTEEQLFIHKWYIAIVLSFVMLLAYINIEILYFVWVLPVFLVQLSQNNFNYFGHMSGYRNFATRDDSKNNIWLFPFILGEAWHNNHHNDPKNSSTSVRRFEIDPIYWFISVIKK
jgi:stearoyl-CoA desaturase (delta-9 desaturase)